MKKSLYIRICRKTFVLVLMLLLFAFGVSSKAHTRWHKADFTNSLSVESGSDYFMVKNASLKNSGSLTYSVFFTYLKYSSIIDLIQYNSNLALPAPPAIVCPVNLASVTDPGICASTVNGLLATINDPDGDITTLTWTMAGATNAASPLVGINNLASFVFNVGITTMTYTVTDAGGTSVSCSFTITVNDNQLPVISCPAGIKATYGEEQCNASVAVVVPIATDNCGIPAVTGTRSDGLALSSPYPAGVTTITWTATDSNGNITSCSQTITVTKGILLINYNFIGASGYPISPNQSATGITCEATSTEPFFVNATEGTASGALSFVDNTVAFPAIYMDPSNFTNTRYFQFHLSGDSLYKYRKFKVYVQARRGNRAAQTINFAYSTDPFSYTVNGSMSLISAGTWYEKVVDWSTVSLINNRSDLFIRLFASNGTGGIGDGRLFIDNFQVVGYDGPLANPNSATIPENTPVILPVLGNDYFGCNGPIAGTPVSVTTFPIQGNVVLNPDGTITYTPNPNVNGNDSFIYQICDASGSCDTSIVNITITPVSYAPMVSCPGDISSGSDIGVCGAQVNDLLATIYDQDGNITTLTWIMTGANNDASPLTGINYLQPYDFNFGVSTIAYIVVDTEGLSDTCSFTVNVFDSENPSIVCPNDTIFTIPACASLTDTVSLVLPLISDPCGIQDLTNNAPVQFPVGTTSVIWIVNDINGNSSACEQIVEVVQTAAINLSISSEPVSCYGGNDGTATASVSGGSPPYTYLWSTVPVQTTPTAVNLTSGTYSVIVTDFDGCSDSATVIVAAPADTLTVSVTNQVNVACFGNSTGSVTVAAAGGTPGYSYSINGVLFQAGNTFSNLPAGVYTITVMDSRNCTNTITVDITQPASALSVSISNQVNVACAGQSTGSATVTASGGVTPYTYSWNTVPVQTGATAINLSTGFYTVIVADSNGCTQSASIFITEPAIPLTATVTALVNAACFGATTGSVTLAGNGGTPPYQYSLNGGVQQASGTFSNLAAGIYTITVTDASNCSVDVPVTIGQPANPLTVSITSQTNIACFGQANGSATALASGGTGPYVYTWLTTPVQSSPTATNLAAGTYTVAVFDANGCFSTTTVTITEPSSALTAGITSQANVTCYGAATGSITITGIGGTPPYQYSINGGILQPGGTFTGLAAGNYTVIVLDANNCATIVIATITQPVLALSVAITSQTNIACSGQSTGSATVTANGGTTPYTYSWNTIPVQTSATISNLFAGNYSVTVTDSLGCTATASVTITEPASPLVIAITDQVNVACFGQFTGSATVTASGGTQPYSYSWNTVPVQTTATVGNLAAGTYTVTVTDGTLCVLTATVVITEPATALSASITSQVNVLCSGSPTGSVTVVGSGGTPPYQYSINGGALQPDGAFTNLAAGNYTIIVLDANNCIFPVFVNLTEPASAVTAVITSQTNIACSGQSTGSATVTANGGTAPYAYSWNTIPVQTTATISNLFAGNYSVTVTDSLGCTAIASVTILPPANPLVVSIANQVNVACLGQSTGSAVALVSGGTLPYSYSWNTVPVQTTVTAGSLAAGTYTLTVTDGAGCTATASVTISEPASALTANVTNQVNVPCSGANTGSITIEGSGGTPPYQYNINDGALQVSGTFNNLFAGIYSVTVIDVNNCITTQIVNITEPATALTAVITNQINILCAGQLTGSATVTVNGGTLPYSYLWSTMPAQTNNTATNLAAGTYTVTVVDGNGCNTTASVTISEPDPLAVLFTNQVNVACFGQATGSVTAQVSGGIAPYTYLWLTVPAQTSATASSLAAGTYTVAIFDSNGCFSSAIVTITEPSVVLSALITNQVNVLCLGNSTGSVTVEGSGGTPGYQYSLNGGAFQSGGTFSNLNAGVYTVTIMDANNCTFDVPVIITEPATGITATITNLVNVLCFGQASGSATITVNTGLPPYLYSLNGGIPQPDGTFNNLVAGSYTVTISDGSSCTLDVPFIITQPAEQLSTVISSLLNVICFGDTNGSATVTASGGTLPYSYSWNTIPEQTTPAITNLVAGTYIVIVSDSNGCVVSDTAIITAPSSPLTATISNLVNVSCFGNATGSVTVTGIGGVSPYQYSLNGGAYQSDGTFSGLLAGNYTITVRDTNNCTLDVPVTITGPLTGLTAVVSGQVNVICKGTATGSATVLALGGIEPLSYLWNTIPAQTTATAVNLPAGTYTVIVTEAGGCTATANVIITEPALGIAVAISNVINTVCFGDTTGAATAIVTDGIFPYTYFWNTVPPQLTATASNLPAGNYTVTVTDSIGCQDTENVIISGSPSALTVSITGQVNIACFGQTTGSASVSVSGGILPYSYSWNTIPVQTTDTASNLPAGNYTVTVTDSIGCSIISSITITGPAAALAANITSQVNVSCNGANTGSITVEGSGGTPPYQYSINGGSLQASGTFSDLFAGIYTVTVTDANNCTVSLLVNIIEPATALTAIISGKTNINCAGQLTGSATVTANGGTLPYAYSWNTIPVQTGTTAINLAAGTYTVTITDASGCVVTADVTIIQPDPLIVTIDNQLNVACFGQSTGSATAQVSGGTPPYTYVWLTVPLQTTATASNLSAGTYTVTIFDSLGCFISTSALITEPASALTASITNQVNVLCLGNPTGSVTVEGSGGTPAYQYSLNGGSFQATGTFSNLLAGVYTVTVMDANNCTVDVPVIITEPANGITATITNLVDILCFGQATGSVTITVNTGLPPYLFSLNGGLPQPDGTFSNLVAGSYFVTISDGSACTLDIPFIISQPAELLTASISSQVNVSCFGNTDGSATVTASGGTLPYLYEWNTIPVQTTPTVSNLTAGTYIVTVTDGNGCVALDTAVITAPASLLTATVTSLVNVACFGAATGSVAVTGNGGVSPYQYSLNGGAYQSDGTFSNLLAGNYTVTVRDTNNCTLDVPVSISQPLTGLTAMISAQVDVVCKGTASGSATVTALGGTSPYTYLWNTIPAQTASTAVNLVAGTYNVIVTDASGCSETASVTITEPAVGISVAISNSINVLCFGDNTGSATALASDGTEPYAYLWNTVPPQATATASGLSAGGYIVLVTDNIGCQDTASVTIYEPATALTGTITNLVNEDCAGNANGSVTVEGAGGTPGYQYSLNGGVYQSGGTFPNLAAGNYTVTVQDANNCSVDVPVTILTSGILLAVDDFATTPENTPVSGNVMANDLGLCFPPVTVLSNTAPMNGSVIVSPDGSFTYTPAPGYNGSDFFTYTITDINGNVSTATVFITIDPFNDPPVTFNELIYVSYNEPESGNVLLNGDYDPDGTALTVNTTPVIYPVNGTFVITADGSFTYTPALNYIGNDTVVVSVCDNGIPLPPACTNDTIFIVVLPANQPPLTVNEYISVCQGSTFVGTVSNGGTVFNGDTDPENSLPLTVSNTLVLGPAHGVFTFTDTITGTFNYTPDVSYTGSDMVIVSICDSGIPVECSNDTLFIGIFAAIIANAGPGQMLCNADVTFLVGNSPDPGTGTWAFVSGPNIPNLFPPVGSVAVTTGLIPSSIPYVYSYTIINGGCTSTDTMSVINFTPPTPSYAGVDQEFCSPGGIVITSLEANTPVYGSGLWTQLSGPNTANILNPTDPNTTVSNLTFGVYAFQWAITNGVCQADADVVNIFITQPAQVNAGGNATICEGSSYLLGSSFALNYTSLLWTSSGSGTFSDPTVLHPTYVPSLTDITNGVVNLLLTAAGIDPCPEVSDQMTLTIYRSPLVFAGEDATICGNSTYTVLDATIEFASSYYWSTSGNGALTDSTALYPTYTPAAGESGQVMLILHVLANSPCTDTADTLFLLVVPESTATAGPDTTICANEHYLVTGSSATNNLGIEWQTSGTGSFDNTAILNPVYTPSPNDINDGFVYLTLIVTGNLSCPSAIDVMKLSIARQPIADAGPDATVCQSSTFIVSQAFAQNYSALSWSTNGLGTLTDLNTLTPSYLPAPGESGIIILTMVAWGNAACGSVTDQMSLFIQTAASVDVGPDLTTCELSPVPVTGSSVSGSSSIFWTTSGNGTFNNSSIVNPVYTPGSFDVAAGSVMLTLSAGGISPCPDVSDQLILTINKAPSANAGPDMVICAGSSYTITQATATNYSTLQWSVSPVSAGTLAGTGTLNPIFTPAAGFSGNATLTLRVQGVGTCSSIVMSSQMIIYVNASLVADAGPDQEVYTGASTALSGAASGGSGFYAWNWQPATLLLNPSDQNPFTLPLNTPVTFTLTVIDISTGCTDDDTVEISIGSGGNSIVAIADFDTTLVNIPVTVDVLYNDIYPQGEPVTISLCGYPSNGIVIVNSDKTITYTPYSDFEGDDFFCYRICDAIQPGLCSDTMVYIHVKQPSLDDITVFNGVSPNSDGNNDTWKVKGIEKYPDNTVMIFNRWGDKVREFANYNNTTRAWEGKNEHGEILPDGTYFYILDVKNVGILKGWIFLRSAK